MTIELTYRQAEDGDYLIPNLELQEQKEVNMYGRMRLKFLQENRPLVYNSLMCKGTLNEHLHEIGETADARIEQMIEEFQKSDPPPDKATDMMGWVQHMNSLKAQAEEIVLAELIYI